MSHHMPSRHSNFLFLFIITLLVSLGFNPLGYTDGPDDNFPENVRLVPPRGLAVAEEKVQQWKTKSESLISQLNNLSQVEPTDRWQIEGLLRAVRMTLEEEMFYTEGEITFADTLMAIAEKRLEALKGGKSGFDLLTHEAPVKNGSRLIIGTFQSDIDNSLQPFGLVVPESWQPTPASPTRLDVWLHGRDERSGEVGFLLRRHSQPGEFTPANTIVLHPYGRYSNAFKFAGEIDVLEGIDFVSKLLPIDPNRISIRGFSMGGAGCWQMAVHYPGKWFAATPGAGFCETTEFLRIFQKEEFKPTTFQKSLLHWYDCPDWSSNLRHLPTIAYSGELDRQKQAADVMEASMRSKGMELLHVIGPQTEHKFHPDSKTVISKKLDEFAIQGREEYPVAIDFTTYTLRYPSHTWITLDRLAKHWEEARIQARRSESAIEITTQNIDRFHIVIPVALFKVAIEGTLDITIDGTKIELSPRTLMTDRSANPKWRLSFERIDGTWKQSRNGSNEQIVKRPNLQGPIDDAFMSSFVFVPPSQGNESPQTPTNLWVASEFKHATSQWKRHFRGDIVTKSADTLLSIIDNNRTADAIREVLFEQNLDCNWVLFGTPNTNPVITKLVGNLPVQWSEKQIQVGDKTYDSNSHALIMIYPNPYLPNRYIVFNSGFTFREYAYLNNARQIPMLPDWAILDANSKSNSQWPGKMVDAGFFDEDWQLAK